MEEIKEEVKVTDEQKIKELTEYLTQLQFFSDTVRFNSILYQGITQILEKLTNMEEKLKSKEW